MRESNTATAIVFEDTTRKFFKKAFLIRLKYCHKRKHSSKLDVDFAKVSSEIFLESVCEIVYKAILDTYFNFNNKQQILFFFPKYRVSQKWRPIS
jgi:hypothetical protein